jgi:hypothetical protein
VQAHSLDSYRVLILNSLSSRRLYYTDENSQILNLQPRTQEKTTGSAQRKHGMARFVFFFASSTLGVSLVTLWWIVRIVVDKQRSTFPAELPERTQKPRRLSLKRLSQKLSSSKTQSRTPIDLSPPYTFDRSNPIVFANSTNDVTPSHVLTRQSPQDYGNDFQASSRTRGFSPRVRQAVTSLKGSSASDVESVQPSATTPPTQPEASIRYPAVINRKPVPLRAEQIKKDPLVDRFERLRLPHGGQLQPRSSAPAVSPPPSHNTSTSPSPSLQATRNFFQSTTSLFGKMAALYPSLPVLREEPSTRQLHDEHNTQPGAVLREEPKPMTAITPKERSDSSTLKRSDPFQRSTQVRKRALSPSRHRATPSSRKAQRRTRSPSFFSSDSEGELTPDSSEDVSTADMPIQATNATGSIRASRPESRRPRFLDSEDAAHLQEELDRRLAIQLQQEEEEQLYDPWHAQLIAAAHPPVTRRPGSITGHHHTAAGTQDDPIDLDADLWSDADLNSISESEASDHVVFRGRNTGVRTPANDPEPMNLDEDDFAWTRGTHFDSAQTDLDAEYAKQLQEELERSTEVAAGTRECAVCGDSYAISELPSLAECEHPPQICAECYSGWIAAQLQGSGWEEANCPEDNCKTKLEYYEIQQIATPETFQQYDNFIARAAISKDRKFHPYDYHHDQYTNIQRQPTSAGVVPVIRAKST